MNFKSIRKEIADFRTRLSAFIDTLPDGNSDVTFLNEKKTCGVVSFSTIAKNHTILCPGYYLNHTAKEELRRIITSTKLENLDTAIKNIIQSGRIPVKGGGNPVRANPEFIEKVKEMWYGEQTYAEHEIIETTCDLEKNGQSVKKGTQGTIIHVHSKHGYEAEFAGDVVMSVTPEEIDYAEND